MSCWMNIMNMFNGCHDDMLEYFNVCVNALLMLLPCDVLAALG